MNMKSKKGTKDKANKNYIWLQKTIDKRNEWYYNKVVTNNKKKGEFYVSIQKKSIFPEWGYKR